jgi:carboxyl-terminal processing protease
MSFRGKIWTLLISSVIAVYVMIGGLPFVGSLLQTQAQQPVNDANAQLRLFEAVLQHIQNDYVDEPDLAKVRFGALRGLVGGLDPYSSYLTAEQVKAYNAGATNGRAGIGAEFSQVSLYLYVVSVLKDSNADKAGLKAGDVVEYIENKATRDISLYDAKEMIMGAPGTAVSLRVLRAGARPQIIKVTRGNTKTPAPEARMEAGRIGVVKVYSLNEGDSAAVRDQVVALQKQGAQKLVLDLRGVAGGRIDDGVAVANLFIREGEIAKVIGKDNAVIKTFTADPKQAIFNGQASVLIDLGTAGAGEVIAAAFIDKKRGDVVGERSFGAGTEQQLYPLRSGDGLLLTTSKWASASGVPFLGDDRTNTGVKPTVEVKRPDTPEPVEVEELIEQQEDEEPTPGTPNAPAPSPTPAAEAKPVEDVQLKRALELLGGRTAAAKAGS